MRLLHLLPVLLACRAAAAQSGTAASPPQAAPGDITARDRFGILLRNTAGLGSIGTNAATAALAQWRDEPPEWGQGAEGYGKRIGHRFAAQAVAGGIEFGASTALREDLRYFRSKKEGFWPRTGDVLRQTLFARTPDGGSRVAASRFIGAYGGALVANTWYPRHSVGDALVRGTVNIGAIAGSNAFREFWPDIKRKLFKR